MLYLVVAYFVWLLGLGEMTTFETIFSVINVGIVLGVCGINVAHELGHREDSFARWMSRLLLIPALYSHFTLEHNYGHHLKVATPEDPATARKNEPVYKFYYRSVVQGYLNAWKIGNAMRIAAGRPEWMNEVLLGHIAQFVLLAFVAVLTGWGGLIAYIGAALIGIISSNQSIILNITALCANALFRGGMSLCLRVIPGTPTMNLAGLCF